MNPTLTTPKQGDIAALLARSGAMKKLAQTPNLPPVVQTVTAAEASEAERQILDWLLEYIPAHLLIEAAAEARKWRITDRLD